MRKFQYSKDRQAQLETFAGRVSGLTTDELLESYRRAAVQEVLCGVTTKSDSEHALAILGGEIRSRLNA